MRPIWLSMLRDIKSLRGNIKHLRQCSCCSLLLVYGSQFRTVPDAHLRFVPEKPTAVLKIFLRHTTQKPEKWILSPIAIVFTLLAYVSATSIRTCQATGGIFCENLHPLPFVTEPLNWSSIYSTTSIEIC